MKIIDPKLLAIQFNECINKKDLKGLTQLMTDDHEFVDRDGSVTKSKRLMTQNWKTFFEMFPDYRNTFTRIESIDNTVVIIGYAYWSDKQPHDPAIWTVRTKDNLILEWRIYDDSADNRKKLSLIS